MPRSFISMFFAGLLLSGLSCGSSEEEKPKTPPPPPEPVNVSETDWPWWRGPNRDGIAPADQSPPLQWSETENVLWKLPIPGRGHSSPIVVGDQVFVTTADLDRGVQTVISIDKNTGRQQWEAIVHRGGIMKGGHEKASQASSSVACDGKRVFVNFLNYGAVYTTALDREGNQLWQTKVTDYALHRGYGSSPAVYGSWVIVSAETVIGGAIAALHRGTGEIVWREPRPKNPNYVSPVILKADGRDQLVFTGYDKITSLDPDTGEMLWETPGATEQCVTTAVTDGQRIFTSGGVPKKHVSAVRADGSGEIVWENSVEVYVPSMIAEGGLLFAVTDGGVATCWKAATGDTLWRHRLGGNFTASPVLAGDHLFATNEAGMTYIIEVGESGAEDVAKNQLGEEVFSTPTICGGRVYLRVADYEGDKRQETLYCLGAE